MIPEWKYIHASVTGTSHIEKNIPCQDSHLCTIYNSSDGGNILILVASDGAGSASKAREGSNSACEIFTRKVAEFLAGGKPVSEITKPVAESWIAEIRNKFAYMASPENASVKDFACTLLAAVIAENEAAFLQVGDGGMVVGNDDETETYCWIFWPEKGDYANQTYFLTDVNVSEHIQFDIINRRITEISLFTDGLERLAFNYGLQEVHNPFFKGFFQVFHADKNMETLNSALADFLHSDRINERTDDDKTLILASRQT